MKNRQRIENKPVIFFLLLVYSLINLGIILILGSFLYKNEFNLFFLQWNYTQIEQLFLIQIKVFDIEWLCIDLFSILTIGLTILILSVAFILSQVSLYLLTNELRQNFVHDTKLIEFYKMKFSWLSTINLLIIDKKELDAFSYTTLSLWRKGKKINNYIVMTTGLIKLFSLDEIEAVLAHEYGHIQHRDTRYSHLIFTLAYLMFFDPFLNFFKNYMNDSQEISADKFSVALVNKPRALAKALYKIITYDQTEFDSKSRIKADLTTSFMSTNKKIILKRIKILLNYAKK